MHRGELGDGPVGACAQLHWVAPSGAAVGYRHERAGHGEGCRRGEAGGVSAARTQESKWEDIVVRKEVG